MEIANVENISGAEIMNRLLDILESQGKTGQAQEFTEVLHQVEEMQAQLVAMADELHGVKEQLANIQPQQGRASELFTQATMQVGKLEKGISDLAEKLVEVKDHLIETAKEAVSVFREKGMEAMCGVLKAGINGVQKLTAGVRESLSEMLDKFDKLDAKLDKLCERIDDRDSQRVSVKDKLTEMKMRAAEPPKQTAGLNRDVAL